MILSNVKCSMCMYIRVLVPGVLIKPRSFIFFAVDGEALRLLYKGGLKPRVRRLNSRTSEHQRTPDSTEN